MELKPTDIFFLVASVSCMALLGEGEDNQMICDYIAEQLFLYNKEHNDIPMPDPIHPECFRFPDDIDKKVMEAVRIYNTEVIEHILHQLEDHAKMEEENS